LSISSAQAEGKVYRLQLEQEQAPWTLGSNKGCETELDDCVMVLEQEDGPVALEKRAEPALRPASDPSRKLQISLEKVFGEQNFKLAIGLAKKIFDNQLNMENYQNELFDKYKCIFPFLKAAEIPKYVTLYFTLVILEKKDPKR